MIIDGFFDDWNDESIVVVEESNFDSEGTELEGSVLPMTQNTYTSE